MSTQHYLLDNADRPALGVDEVLLGLLELQGNVSEVAKRLERPRWVVQKLIDETPTLLIAYQDIREGRVDKAEKTIDKALDADDLVTARYVASTLGRNRGYSTRVENTGRDGGPVIVQWDEVEGAL